MEDSAACASQAERGLLGSASRERDKSAKDFRHEITLAPNARQSRHNQAQRRTPKKTYQWT